MVWDRLLPPEAFGGLLLGGLRVCHTAVSADQGPRYHPESLHRTSPNLQNIALDPYWRILLQGSKSPLVFKYGMGWVTSSRSFWWSIAQGGRRVCYMAVSADQGPRYHPETLHRTSPNLQNIALDPYWRILLQGSKSPLSV